ncbi:glycosyl hydrolase 115 family protein [Actinopolyspora saharensis]|uniref:Glycosyl hydrolase family 115 n=1 Tax=Actinopolyspora saharensis TaxID=995062 RepID=A0A1H0YW07_9ACTN|nr:glycosyl hydrolase 115 family protein [Actinopolyspora saharensis]SDQ19417.1 Glycosyl hydrolase family 115 [Actinopolyspora saharensis]
MSEHDRRAFLRTTGAAAAGVAALSATSAAGAGAEPAGRADYIVDHPVPGGFPLATRGRVASLVVDAEDHEGVVRVVDDLRRDLHAVTGLRPRVANSAGRRGPQVVIGTIGRSRLIDGLVESGKLDVDGIAGEWETSLEQIVENPFDGVERALVLAGSDQRGTIYACYDVSARIGVSPWYWWDDVPARQHEELFVLPGRHTQGPPAVKYRGFFINDEAPALNRWAPEHFGPGKAPGHPNGFNHEFYAKVFETMLRLKANYLWPAMWGRAFAEDDPLNHETAAKYGIVMGTAHNEPMLRGIEEWNRNAVPAERDEQGNIVKPGHDPYGGTGEWSFLRNRPAIEAYWTEGIRRMVQRGIEGVVTLGMRGNGDFELGDGDSKELMRRIVDSQRSILRSETGSDPAEVPQVWTLYKEVQRYWDEGLRPPDDVTVVITDDNWGNLRKLPDPELSERPGGYGLYYHYDYVGTGRNYKWVDTSPLPNIWDQLNQAYSYGVDRLWVVNVGDFKGMERPLQFFLDYAWDPQRWPVSRLTEWEHRFVEQNFGSRQAGPIADVLHGYAVLQARRKPELLNRRITVDPDKDLPTDPSAVVYDDRASPFSLSNYRELERVTEEWKRLVAEAERVREQLPEADRAGYYELVLYRVKASANLYELRLAEFTNLLYADQRRAATNGLAETAEARFADDQAMSDYYNNELAGGKWKGFQTQPKIGYGDVERYGPQASWQQPQRDNTALPDAIFPPVRRVELPAVAEMGVAIDGSERWWPHAREEAVLPAFSPYQSGPAQYIEVFNRGSVPFDYGIEPAVPWITVDSRAGRVVEQVRATVRVDWKKAPEGVNRVPITVSGPGGSRVEVLALVDNRRLGRRRRNGFVEADGHVSIEGENYARAVGTRGVSWQRIPDIGRTGSGMEPFPVTAAVQRPGGASPRLEYRATLFTTGEVDITVHVSPRNNVFATEGLRYAVSVDDAAPQVVNITAATGADATKMNRQWQRNTSDNINRTTTRHTIPEAGVHLIKVWMVDPTVVVQKIVVDTGGQRYSYLGPPESTRRD